MYLSAHGAKHSWSRLYLLCDVAELIRARGQDIRWDRIIQQARVLHTERILNLSLLLTVELFDVELPPEVRERLCADAGLKKMAIQICSWLFDPSIDGSMEEGGLTHHFFRARMLQKPHEKVLYLVYRAMRKLSKVGAV